MMNSVSIREVILKNQILPYIPKRFHTQYRLYSALRTLVYWSKEFLNPSDLWDVETRRKGLKDTIVEAQAEISEVCDELH